MTVITPRSRNAVTTMAGALVVFYAITFLLGALLHLGARVPMGSVVLVEPRIVPATIVETLCGLLLASSAYAVFARRSWAWSAILGAHAFALAGVLLGMVAIAVGAGPSTELNDIYHRVMLTVLTAGLILLLTPAGRTVFGRGARGSYDRADPPPRARG